MSAERDPGPPAEWNVMEKISVAMEWANRIAAAKSTAALHDALAEAAEWLGARYFALLHHVDFAAVPQALRLHNYPDGWEEYYGERRLALSDPIHRASHRMVRGFLWSDLPQIIRLDRADNQMLRLGAQIGLGEGVTVPMHVPGEARGSCTFVSEIGTRLPDYSLFLAQMLGGHAFDQLRWLQGGPLLRKPRLSRRQRQCAALAASGHSNLEIAIKLGITLQTVMAYLHEAFARIGVGSRTELAIALLRLGDLSFDDVPPRSAPG